MSPPPSYGAIDFVAPPRAATPAHGPVRVPGGGRGARAAVRARRAEPQRLAPAALAGWGGLQDGGASNATANATDASAGAAAASFTPTAPPTTSPEILLYKRTHASADAEADALFLHTYFGMNVTINETIYKDVGPNGEQGGSLCAKRFGVGTLPREISRRRFLSRSGGPPPSHPQVRDPPLRERGRAAESAPVAEWVDYWRELHAGFQSGDTPRPRLGVGRVHVGFELPRPTSPFRPSCARARPMFTRRTT